jgi:hypothetical protein
MTVYSGLAGISLTNTTVYFPIGGGSLASATEASVQTPAGAAGTVGPGFAANLSANLGGSNAVVLTWRKNGGNQAVTCTITSPATTCSDTTHSFSFNSGDTLDISAVLTGTIAATPIWVINAAIATGTVTAAGAHGSAQFSATGGTITGLLVTGCVTGATYSAMGIYAITVSGCPSNYGIQLTIGDNSTFTAALVYAGTYSGTGFTVLVDTATVSGSYDPALVFITIP